MADLEEGLAGSVYTPRGRLAMGALAALAVARLWHFRPADVGQPLSPAFLWHGLADNFAAFAGRMAGKPARAERISFYGLCYFAPDSGRLRNEETPKRIYAGPPAACLRRSLFQQGADLGLDDYFAGKDTRRGFPIYHYLLCASTFNRTAAAYNF